MFDEDHFEGWVVAWDLVRKYLEVPLPKELLQLALKIWSERPR